MRICGIDPGASGALAFIGDGRDETVYDMPISSMALLSKTVSHEGVFEILKKEDPGIIVLEKQGPQGVTSKKSIFPMGRNYQSLLIGVYRYQQVSNASVEVVTPQKWKRKLGLVADKGATDKDKKKKTADKADQLFPGLIYGKRGGLKDGRSDALMIAWYGRILFDF